MNHSISRRSFLVGGVAVSGTLTLPLSARAEKVPVRNSGLPAGKSGTIWIGGDLQVNRIGLGTTEFTTARGVVRAEPKDIRALLRRAIDLGVNHLDCADVYGSGLVEGQCERFIYDALYPYPRDLVIATKAGQRRGVPGAATFQIVDGRPEYLRSACEASLRRLRLEQLPLYYFHQPDPKVPYADSIGELGKLQKEGKIRHIGVSNVNAEQLATARSLVKVVAVQNRYNILTRDSEEILQSCERERTAFIPYSPLGGRDAAIGSPDARRETERLAVLQALATERKVSMTQIVLAWLLARSPLILAIPGTTKIDHLEENVAAGLVHLTPQEMQRMAQV